jgi:hypothetical protein
MKPRARSAGKRKPAHDTPEMGPKRAKVRPLGRKPDPKGRYETGMPDPDATRKSPWVDEGEPESSG